MIIGTSADFAKTSWFWELQQLMRNGGEWVDLQFQQLHVDLPDLPRWSIPPWWESVLLWGVLVILGVGSVLLLEQLWMWGRRSLKSWQRYQASLASANNLKAVPLLSVAEWLAQAHAEHQRGNFKAACRALYCAVLRQLHEQQLIRDQPSLTDQEYLQQVEALHQRSQVQHLQPYQTLLQTHERLCFSHAVISEQDYQQCYQASQTILAEIQPPRV